MDLVSILFQIHVVCISFVKLVISGVFDKLSLGTNFISLFMTSCKYCLRYP